MKEPSFYIPEIFTREAKSLLADFIASPVGPSFMLADRAALDKAEEYIVQVFDECYSAGHLQVAVYANEEGLIGYAMVFVIPEADTPRYLHKIHVLEPFRGYGVGSEVLRTVLEDSRGLVLLTLEKNVPFYEKAGLYTFGPQGMPGGENFTLTKGMYEGLTMMADRAQGVSGAPIFMLNDKDVRAMLGMLAGA